jgi:RND family efflux transporter MFP subunit
VKTRNLLYLTFAMLMPAPAMAQGMDECLIEPWRVVRLAARTTGVLSSLSVDRGDTLSEGTVVASLNSEVEKASLALAQARAASTAALDLTQARVDFEEQNLLRAETLFSRKVSSNQQIDEARTTLRLAKLQVAQSESDRELAKLELARAQAIFDLKTVISPVDGIVMSVDRTVGEFLGDGDHIATLAVIDPLRAEVFLSLDHLTSVRLGMKVKVLPQLKEMGELEGVVEVVDRVIDARSGSFGVRIRLQNPELKTIAGMRCTADFVANSALANE